MATDKNFVIKNGLTVGTSEIITSAGNLTNIGTIDSGAITAPSLQLGSDTQPTLSGDGNLLRIQTSSGYLDIGSNNSGFAHIQTDRSKFYFNKRILVDEGIISSYDEDLVLQRAQSTVATFTTTGATFAGTIESGAITASADISVVESSDAKVISNSVGDYFPSLEIKRTSGVSKTNYHWRWQLGSSGFLNLVDATNSYYPIIFKNNGDVAISNDTDSTNPVLLLDKSAESATFAGTISSDFITADHGIKATDIWTSNEQPATDNAIYSGYGAIGNRGTFYITNGGGVIQIGNGTTHATNPTATFSTSAVNLGASRVFQINGTTVIDSSRNLTNIGTINSGAITSTGNLVLDASGHNYIELHSSTANTRKWRFYNGQAWNPDALLIYDQDADSTALTIETNKLGIARGANSLSHTLDVGGNVAISGTEIITSSRNLTNIGTISSGAITSTGLVTSVGGVINTNTGSNAFYVTRSGATNQALKIYVDDASAVFESIQDESLDNYGTFIFAMDGGTTEPFFDVRKGTAASGSKFRVDGSGALQVGSANTTFLDANRNLTNIGTISSTGLVKIDGNGTPNTLHVHDDSTSGQPGLFVTNTDNYATSTQTFYAKQYGSGISATIFGQSVGSKAFVGTEGSASGGLLIGTTTADSVWIGTNNTAALTINSSQNATFAGTISSGAITASSGITANGPFKSGGSNNYILFDYDGDFTGGNYYAIQDTSANRLRISYGFSATDNLELDASGNFYVNGGNATFSGTISSGAQTITSTGTIGTTTPGNGYLQVTDGSSTLALDPNEIYSSDNLVITTGGDFDIRNGSFSMANQIIITSSLNLINIGTIDSGAITSSGNITASGTSHSFLSGDTSGQLRVGRNATEHIRLSVTDFEALIEHRQDETTNNHFMTFNINSPTSGSKYFNFTNGDIYVGGTQIIDSSRNLTNIGTISSGAITANGGTVQHQFISSSDGPIISKSTDSVSGIGFEDNSATNYLFYVGSSNHFYFNSGTLSVGGATLGSGNTFNVAGGIGISGTTIVDSARNIRNVPSGAFTGGSYAAGIDSVTDAGVVLTQTKSIYSLASSNNYLRNIFQHDSSNNYIFGQFGTSLIADLYLRCGSSGTIFFNTNGTTSTGAKVDSGGNFIAQGNVTAYGSVSDIRRKENVEIIPDALDKIKTLDGITFNFKDRPKERMTGVIAQQVEKILPEAVYETTTMKNEETKAVHYGNMVGLLIEAMKEQQKQIDELKEEVSSLRSKN